MYLFFVVFLLCSTVSTRFCLGTLLVHSVLSSPSRFCFFTTLLCVLGAAFYGVFLDLWFGLKKLIRKISILPSSPFFQRGSLSDKSDNNHKTVCCCSKCTVGFGNNLLLSINSVTIALTFVVVPICSILCPISVRSLHWFPFHVCLDGVMISYVP